MEKSSHYYALLSIARICGVKKEIAEKIAYASQFVDDNTSDNIVITSIPRGAEKICKKRNNLIYIAKASSCHSYFKPSTITYHAMISNTVLFHFFPVGKFERDNLSANKCFAKRIRCRKNSPSINKMVDHALKKSPEIFGMILHVYADTFSHQGFSGIFSKENDIDNLKWSGWSPFKRIKFFVLKKINKYYPTYGHMQAIKFPDDPTAKWEYLYDNTDDYSGHLNPKENMARSVRENSKEYKEAFEKISEIINKYLKKNPGYKDKNPEEKSNLKNAFFRELAQKKRVKKRKKCWQGFMIQNKLFEKNDPALKYDKFKWIREAFPFSKTKYFKNYEIPIPQIPVKHLAKTSWYKFITGVLWFKEESLKLLKKEYGLDIPHPYVK